MIDHDAYDAAERQRDEQVRQAAEAAQDTAFLPQLHRLFETRGAAYVSAELPRLTASFPAGFMRRHVRVEGQGTAYQRVQLRCDLGEAA